MEGSGVEFEANNGKDEDGKGDEEANLKAKYMRNFTLYHFTRSV